MSQARIVIISGSPGSGKSSIARLLAESSDYKQAVHIHTDDFYKYIRKGYIEPWRPSSDRQNKVVAETMVSCANSFVEGGYEVFVDGIVGPWHLQPWINAAQSGINIFYAVLHPELQTTISRAVNRKGTDALVDLEVIRHMWNEFNDLDLYEPHIIDTTDQTVEESVTIIKNMISEGYLRIK